MFACLFILFKEVFQKKLSSPQNFFFIVIVIVIVKKNFVSSCLCVPLINPCFRAAPYQGAQNVIVKS
jgi:hypothetical protein